MINGVHHISLATADGEGPAPRPCDVGIRHARDPDDNIVELQEIFPGSQVDKSHIRGIQPPYDRQEGGT
jgi:hypothetical protein